MLHTHASLIAHHQEAMLHLQEVREWVNQMHNELRKPETLVAAVRLVQSRTSATDVRLADLLERCRCAGRLLVHICCVCLWPARVGLAVACHMIARYGMQATCREVSKV